MKICYKCKVEQDESCFVKSKNRKDGLNPTCKSCSKLYREENKETLLRKKREYYAKNIDIMPERNRAKYEKHKVKQINQMRTYYSIPENWLKRMLLRAKSSNRGWEFAITAEDVSIPKVCPYLGWELTFTLGKGQCQTNASIDRIDSTKGYIKGNVQIISRKANTMKSNATQDELERFAKSILGLTN